MNAMPKPRPDFSAPEASSAPATLTANATGSFSTTIAASLADATRAGSGVSPPHRLWETLESAYATPVEYARDADDERLPLSIALPLVLGLSLALWGVIIELVLMLRA